MKIQSIIKLLSFFLTVITFCCKGKINYPENTQISAFSNSDSVERIDGETVIDFINRVENRKVDLNHPIIETEKWISNTNIIFVFENKELEDDLGVYVYGFLYASKEEKIYHKVTIDSYGPEGGNAFVESIFFTNADEDDNLELVILCSWVQRFWGVTEGKLFNTYIYDDLDLSKKENKLFLLEDISSHFSNEFEGIQEGKIINAKYKNARSIKNELKSLGY